MSKREPLSDTNSNQLGILVEKISIPSPMASVPRPRLRKLFEQSLRSCTSTIVSGRAGSGKTILALDFIEQAERAVAWYTVSAPDGELQIFFDYLVSSIRARRPNFGNNGLLSLLQRESADLYVAQIAETFVFELERQPEQPLLIVIEDLHLVSDSSWLVPFLQRLLPLLPTDVHVLITSRTPPATLWRMRSKQTLSVIDEETLAFTREEAIRLFEQFGLSREQACIALDYSHGRAAGLSQLAAKLYFAASESLTSEPNRRFKVG